MKLLHHAFDKLELSLQGAVPASLRETLAEAKEQAQRSKQDRHYIAIGPEERMIAVRPNGSLGGYAFSFDTGKEALLFHIKNQEKREDWNLRCIISSLKLATDGFENCICEMADWLHYLEAVGTNGERGNLCAKISRADVCFDYLLDEGFTLEPEAFICHSHMLKETNYHLLGNSSRHLSLRIGKMPNKQVAVYNKSQEIQKSKKHYWHEIWNDSATRIGANVWRFELRSGKNHLDTFEARLLSDFRQQITNVTADIHQSIRYVTLGADSNRSRLPNTAIWQQIGELIPNLMVHSTPGGIRYEGCLPYLRYTNRQIRLKQMLGTAVGLAVEDGFSADDIETYLDELADDFKREFKNHPERYRNRFARAAAKTAFMDGGVSP